MLARFIKWFLLDLLRAGKRIQAHDLEFFQCKAASKSDTRHYLLVTYKLLLTDYARLWYSKRMVIVGVRVYIRLR